MVSHLPSQPSVACQPQAEGEAGWLRQFAHQTAGQEPIVGIQAGDARLPRVQDQAQRILVAQQRHAAVAQAIGERFSLLQPLQQLTASLGPLPVLKGFFAGGQQQRTGAGGLQQAQAAFHAHGIQTLPLQPEHRCLRQCCSRLLQGMHHQISAAVQSAGGEGMVHPSGEMTAVGFIHQHATALLLQPLNYCRWVIGIALVGGMHQNCSTDGGSIAGQGLKHPFDPGRIRRCRLAPVALKGEIEQHRPQVPKNAGLNQAAMHVAGQQHPLSGPDHGQQCGLQQPRGPVHPVPAARHPHRCRGGALAVCDGAVRLQRTAKGW